MFKRAIIVVAMSIAPIAHAGGGLSLGGTAGSTVGTFNSTTGATNTSFSVTQGNTVGTNGQMGAAVVTTLGSSVGYTAYASFSSASFDPSTWTMTGGTFTPAASFKYVSSSDISTYTSAVQTSLTNAVTNEVTYIGTLLADTSAKISAYNAEVHTDTSSSDATKINGVSAADVTSSLAALNSEVDNTRSAITAIKGLKFNTVGTSPLTGTVKTVSTLFDPSGQVLDYSTKISSIITSGTGNNTIGSTGAVTFGN